MHKVLLASVSVLGLAACGGGSTGGGTAQIDNNGISTDPINGPEIEQFLTAAATATGTDVSGALVDLGTGAGSGTEDELFAGITPRDLTAAGSASYDGVVILADLDTSDIFDVNATVTDIDLVSDTEEDLPSYLVMGRSTMNITFGNDPSVSGGANGFIGLNFEALNNLTLAEIEALADADPAEIIAALPTADVGGSLTYAGGSILDLDPEFEADDDEVLEFDVTGSLALPAAVTGGGAQNVDIDGDGYAAVANDLAIGLIDATTTDQNLGGIFIGIDD